MHTDSACVRVCIYITKHFSMHVHQKNLDINAHAYIRGPNLAKGRDPRGVGEDEVFDCFDKNIFGHRRHHQTFAPAQAQ